MIATVDSPETQTQTADPVAQEATATASRAGTRAQRVMELIRRGDEARAAKANGDEAYMDLVFQELDRERFDLGDPTLDMVAAYVVADKEEVRVQVQQQLVALASKQDLAVDSANNGTVNSEQAEIMQRHANQEAQQTLEGIKAANPELAERMQQARQQADADPQVTAARAEVAQDRSGVDGALQTPDMAERILARRGAAVPSR